MLKQCHERGQTVVLVTHDANVASAADRVVRMRDGEIIGEKPPRRPRALAATSCAAW